MMFSLAWESLKNRRKSVALTFISLLISISVLISVEHIRVQAKDSFNRTISGVDLIVGAPSGQLNLLLYSVFRMGSPTNSIQLDSFEKLKNNRLVEWAIPISLGDSHRGFRVMGTNADYFKHFQYGQQQALEFAEGKPFADLFDVVLGADVAASLNYRLGDKIVVSHGIGTVSFTKHEQAPFAVAGILAPTGTPVDKTLHVSLAGIEAIHLSPSKLAALLASKDAPEHKELSPKILSAVLLGLKSRMAVFALQRNINDYSADRLMAILPGVAMAELWQMMGTVENLLRVISLLVLVSSLLGLAVMLLASMRERQREIAILRVIGATPVVVFALIVLEAMLLALFSLVAAIAVTTTLFSGASGWLASQYGLFLDGSVLTIQTAQVSGAIMLATLFTALLPAIEAYRSALHVSLSSNK